MQANDFGSEVIPGAKDMGMHVQAYLYDGYWEDIGTIEAFYQSNLALTNSPKPDFRSVVCCRLWTLLCLPGRMPPQDAACCLRWTSGACRPPAAAQLLPALSRGPTGVAWPHDIDQVQPASCPTVCLRLLGYRLQCGLQPGAPAKTHNFVC